MGEGSYKLVYALVSVLGIALIAWGFAHYRATGMIDVWESAETLVVLKHITLALMLPAVILVVAAFCADTSTRRSSIRCWRGSNCGRQRICWPMAILARSSCSARSWAGRCSTASRSNAGPMPAAPPIPVGGWGNDMIAVAVGIVVYLALAFAFHPVVIGVPVVGV